MQPCRDVLSIAAGYLSRHLYLDLLHPFKIGHDDVHLICRGNIAVPGGLPNRWIIKGMIPLSFLAMAISGIGMMLRSINILRGYHLEEEVRTTSHIS